MHHTHQGFQLLVSQAADAVMAAFPPAWDAVATFLHALSQQDDAGTLGSQHPPCDVLLECGGAPQDGVDGTCFNLFQLYSLKMQLLIHVLQ